MKEYNVIACGERFESCSIILCAEKEFTDRNKQLRFFLCRYRNPSAHWKSERYFVWTEKVFYGMMLIIQSNRCVSKFTHVLTVTATLELLGHLKMKTGVRNWQNQDILKSSWKEESRNIQACGYGMKMDRKKTNITKRYKRCEAVVSHDHSDSEGTR